MKWLFRLYIEVYDVFSVLICIDSYAALNSNYGFAYIILNK